MWRLQQVFDRWHKAELPQFFLWLPVCLGCGMALYYALPYEPSTALHAALPLLLLTYVVRHRLSRPLALALLALMLAATGASYAKFRTDGKHNTMLAKPLPITPLEGHIDALEHVDGGLRITLSALTIKGLQASHTPNRVRVSFRAKKLPDLVVGQHVALRAALLPPSGPVMPNAFDFSRYFFFRDIGAVGYAITPITIKESHTPTGLRAALQHARDELTTAIHTTLPGVNGTIASGLITGDDAAIPRDVHEELRAANLLHIIAISGAHMVVVGGIVFVVLRSLLVLIPGFGQRPVVKTITAFLTLIAITAYVAITGFELSAVRAYVMLAIVLVGILLARDAQPMRSIALAALLMLAFDPSDVIEPGFQLSFAATLALIATFETMFKHQFWEEAGMLRRGLRVLSFLCLTTLVAQAATTPIILFHFNNLTLYGLPANLILTPVVTFILMPMVALYFVLLPLGLEAWALYIMDIGIDAMLWVAHEVAGWPNAITYHTAPTEWGIALASMGLLWLCIWRSRARLLGVPLVVAGTATCLMIISPQLLLSPRAQQIALHTSKGYVMLRGRSESLFAELWANGTGHASFAEYREKTPIREAECTRDGCTLTLAEKTFRISHTVADIKQGCPHTTGWISGYYLYPSERKGCTKGVQFIDRANFDANGSYWAFVRAGEVEWHHTRGEQGLRPWSLGWNAN